MKKEILSQYSLDSLTIILFLITLGDSKESLSQYNENIKQENFGILNQKHLIEKISKININETIIESIYANYSDLSNFIGNYSDPLSLENFQNYLSTLNRTQLLYTLHYRDVFHEIHIVNDDIIKFHSYCLNEINSDLLLTLNQIFYKSTDNDSIASNLNQSYHLIDPNHENIYDNPEFSRLLYGVKLCEVLENIHNPYDTFDNHKNYYAQYSSFFRVSKDCGLYFLRKVLNEKQLREFIELEKEYSRGILNNSFFYNFYCKIKEDESILNEYPLEWIFHLVLVDFVNP